MNNIITYLLLLSTMQVAGAGTGRIVGKIVDDSSNLPVGNVKIELIDFDRETLSDDGGRFILDGLDEGVYALRVSKDEYADVNIGHVTVENEAETEVYVRLIKNDFTGEKTKTKAPMKSYSYKPARTSRSTNHSNKTDGQTEPGKVKTDSPDPKPAGSSLKQVVIGHPRQAYVAAHSGLFAGYADDNQQFNYFLKFIDRYKNEIDYYPLHIEERICLKVLDKQNKPIPNAVVEIPDSKTKEASGKTYADGSFFIYPKEMKIIRSQFNAKVISEDYNKVITIDRNGPRVVEAKLDYKRPDFTKIPLDIAFILDVTGSMQEELERLKSTIELVNLNLSSLNIDAELRYGMVAYRDKEDDFTMRTIPLTPNLAEFQEAIRQLTASGGGDDPEDLQAALKEGIQGLEWNGNGIRLAFIITDAGTHLDYGQEYTYANAARDAKEMAVKIFTIGTGGLPLEGEFILRQIAQYTYGKYIFLTYGETGESEGGKPGSVSHHTGSNFSSDKLESIIIRFTKEELAHLSEIEIQSEEPYFQATRVDEEEKRETLGKLFLSAINELDDFSTLAIPNETRLSVLPITVKLESQLNNAEYFTEQLQLALSRNSTFKLIERKDLQSISDEMALQLSGILDLERAVKMGKIYGVEALIIGNMFFNENNYELYLKLVRVETAEILSVTKLKIDYRLGL